MTLLLRPSFCAAVVLAPLAAFAHSDGGTPGGWQPTVYDEAAAHAPRPLPDRIVLTWNGDSATSQAVTWRTDVSVLHAIAELAVAGDHGPAMEAAPHVARTTDFTSDLGEAHYHSVTFKQLSPDTLYAYRVGDGVNWSEWFHFRTAKAEPAPFTFVYFGDAQNDVRTHWSRVFREAFREAPRAAFTLHAGDLINRANRDAEWGEWFGAPAWVHGTVPVIATPGNHEYARVTVGPDEEIRVLSNHWRPQFEFPNHGPDGLEETAYFIDYQGVRIIALNSNELQAEQIEWLRNALETNRQRWTILTFHHPIFSPARARDNPQLRNLWKPLIDEFKVDLVLTGHDHSYARSGDVSARVGTANTTTGYQQVYDPAIGTVYVVSVSGPKMYELTGTDWAVRQAEDTQLYQIITVAGDTLHYVARTATNRLYDRFTLEKQPEGRPNLLHEALPPERRR